MGLFDDFIKKIAPTEDEGLDLGSIAEEQETTPYIPRDPRFNESAQPSATNPVRMSGNGTSVMGSAIEMKVVKPDRFEMVADIADLLLAGNTVLLNLEETNKETTRRLIDFMTGVAYAIKGDLRRIANNTYVVTPNNVRVSDSEEISAIAADGEVY